MLGGNGRMLSAPQLLCLLLLRSSATCTGQCAAGSSDSSCTKGWLTLTSLHQKTWHIYTGCLAGAGTHLAPGHCTVSMHTGRASWVAAQSHEGPLSCWKRSIPVGLFHLLLI